MRQAMLPEKVEISSLQQLRDAAEKLQLAYPQGARVGLRGALGAGKTQFVRTFVEVLAEKANLAEIPAVVSPSFVIHHPIQWGATRIDHYDFYRLHDVSERVLWDMGYFDCEMGNVAQEKQAYVFVEWPERSACDLQLDCELAFETPLQGRWLHVLHTKRGFPTQGELC